MNKSKIIALIIALGAFFGPFYYLFVRNNGNDIVDSAFEMFMFLGWILGWIIAFGISVNEPFDRKAVPAGQSSTGGVQKSKAA